MKKLVISVVFAFAAMVGVEAAPTDPVTQDDLKALLTRLSALEAENKAQAAKIRELEQVQKKNEDRLNDVGKKATIMDEKFELQNTRMSRMSSVSFAPEGDTTTNETGRIFTTSNGKKYYLADTSARIFEPLTESGFQFTPYGYLVLEGVWADRDVNCDWSTDFVSPRRHHVNHTTLSMQDSILGMQFMTPEAINGWKFSGKAEFDLAGDNQNDYAFHWRHLYVNAEHETGWSILFGQTWHLWKIVSPSEIDGAWMENAGHPYRRSPQIRVTKRWDWEDSSFEARVGIVKGGPGMGGDRDEDKVEDNSASAWALFETALVYDHDAPWQDMEDPLQAPRWLVGVGGMYGQDSSHRWTGEDFSGDEDDYDSMMGLLAGSIPFWRFTLQGQIYAGENLGGIQAGCGQRVIYHDPNTAGKEVRTLGGFFDLGYQFNEDWNFAFGYGFDNPEDGDVEGGVNGDGVIFNDRVYIDAFYQITSNFKLGFEYARLLTRYTDTLDAPDQGGSYGANRFQFSAYFDF